LPVVKWIILDQCVLGAGLGVVGAYALEITETYFYGLLANGVPLHGPGQYLLIIGTILAAFGVVSIPFAIRRRSLSEIAGYTEAASTGAVLSTLILFAGEIYYVSGGRVYNVEPITYFGLEALAAAAGGALIFTVVAMPRATIRQWAMPLK